MRCLFGMHGHLTQGAASRRLGTGRRCHNRSRLAPHLSTFNYGFLRKRNFHQKLLDFQWPNVPRLYTELVVQVRAQPLLSVAAEAAVGLQVAADEFEICLNTARTNLQHLFEKDGDAPTAGTSASYYGKRALYTRQ